MMKLRTGLAIGAVVAAITTAAVAQHAGHGGNGGHTTSASNTEMQPAPSDTPFVKAFKEAHHKMMRDMDIKLSGNPDVDFVRGMIPHHQGAIDMAKIQLAHGKDPALRKMAEQIVKEQEREIGEMQDWLKKNDKPHH
jgi:uncharacterized protein (DUF305 family)